MVIDKNFDACNKFPLKKCSHGNKFLTTDDSYRDPRTNIRTHMFQDASSPARCARPRRPGRAAQGYGYGTSCCCASTIMLYGPGTEAQRCWNCSQLEPRVARSMVVLKIPNQKKKSEKNLDFQNWVKMKEKIVCLARKMKKIGISI